jgi:NADPH:quinone reductase-like Zn-dependent oxidoreductase
MKAVVLRDYGPPEQLQLQEVRKPVPGDTEVLVRVRAASANAGDWHVMRADPFIVRFVAGGILKPKNLILGSDIAGRVEAVGKAVDRFQPGDEVFGNLAESGFGAFAEYACAPEEALVRKPERVSFEDAAAVPVAALAALQGLRDKGRIAAGDRVLVNGASGGVGTFAVQIAKALGAHVTGVCSTANVDLVRAIGADDVLDYTRQDVTRSGKFFDVILDAAAFRPVSDYLRILAPEGRYVMVGGATRRMLQTMLRGPLVRLRSKRRLEFLLSRSNARDLARLRDLVATGAIAPVIDRRFDLHEVPDAMRYLEAGRSRGKVVIRVDMNGSDRP